jgi:hypothetical protein
MEEYNYSIEGKVTADDYIKTNFLVLKKNGLLIAGITILIFSVILVIPDILAGKPIQNYTLFFALGLILFMYLVFIPLTIRRNYNKSAKMQDMVYWKFSNEKMIVKTTDTENGYIWNEFKRYHESKNYILFELKVPKRTVRFLPKRFLIQSGIEEEFKKFIKKIFEDMFKNK